MIGGRFGGVVLPDPLFDPDPLPDPDPLSDPLPDPDPLSDPLPDPDPLSEPDPLSGVWLAEEPPVEVVVAFCEVAARVIGRMPDAGVDAVPNVAGTTTDGGGDATGEVVGGTLAS